MSAEEKPKDVIDDIFDELNEETPSDETEKGDSDQDLPPDGDEGEGDESAGAGSSPDPTDDEEDDAGSDTDGESESDDDDSDAGDDDESDESDDTDSADDSASEDLEKKRSDALLRDLTKARKRNADLQRQLAMQQPVAPPPGQTTAPPQPPVETPPVQGPAVRVSEDGKQVFVDPESFQEAVRREAQAVIEQATKPTPEQIEQHQRALADQQLHQDFPEEAGRAQIADEFLTESLKSLIAQGHRPNTLDEIKQLFSEVGIRAQLTANMPELDPVFDEFVEAFASGQPAWKRSVVQRMKSEAPALRDSGDAKPKRQPSPPSLARKGGSRTAAPTSDRMEFQELEKEFQKNTIMMDKKRYDRMKELGRKLGEEGY